ncbi:MAG: hypothetical protein RLZZ480_913 [Candidatus Parcubacteria bacterium]|jgi:hypothetical protein
MFTACSMYKKLLVTACIAAIIATMGFLIWKSEQKLPTTNNQVTPSNMETEKKITFAGKEYKIGFVMPSGGTDFRSESYEWVTDGETVEAWNSLITTHKLTPTDANVPLSAEAYAQNVVSMLQGQGAMILETSLINQDIEALGIDPNHPPYLLVYLFSNEDTTEFNMQKITQSSDGEVISAIYAERFKNKPEAEMRAYYESKERTDKRTELIRLSIPY